MLWGCAVWEAPAQAGASLLIHLEFSHESRGGVRVSACWDLQLGLTRKQARSVRTKQIESARACSFDPISPVFPKGRRRAFPVNLQLPESASHFKSESSDEKWLCCSTFAPSAHSPPENLLALRAFYHLHDHNQWLKESANPELVTIQYAGTVAVEIICEMHGWDYEQWRRSDLADFLFIDEWCHETFTDVKQRSRVKKACHKQAREILLRHWDAVDMLAVDLLQFGWTPGNEAHRIIRQAIGETEDDWRLTVSNSEHQ